MKSFMPRLHSLPFLFLLLLSLLQPVTSLAASFDLEKEVQTSLGQMLSQTRKIQARLAEGRPIAAEVSALKKRAAALARQHEVLQERFRSRGDAVNIHGLKIWQRHHEVFSRYQETMERILALIDLLPAGGSVTTEEINTLHNLLNSVLPKKKQRFSAPCRTGISITVRLPPAPSQPLSRPIRAATRWWQSLTLSVRRRPCFSTHCRTR